MAKDEAKSKTKKRQPAKSRLSSSLGKTSKKPLAKKAVRAKAKVSSKTAKAKKTTVKKKVATKKTAKKVDQAKKKAAVKRSQARKKPAAKTKVRRTKRTRDISIPLGRGIRLTLTIKLSKPPAKKRKARGKRGRSFQKTLAAKRQFLVSLAMVFAGAFGTIYFGLQVVAAPLPQGNDTPISTGSTVPAPTEKYLPRSEAKQLQIPTIDLDTKLISLGRNPDGTLETPERYDIAGFYKFGPTPGEKGPAVITGHLDNYYSGPAVFWRLRELKPGEIIKVDRADGKSAKFKVNSVKEYSQNDFPTQQVYGDIDYAGLRLITCGGSFNYISQRYSDNTVVFASLVR